MNKFGMTDPAYDLVPTDWLEQLPKLASQAGKGDEGMVYLKFFLPTGTDTYWLMEYDPETKEAFGLYVTGQMYNPYEYGYFNVGELASLDIVPQINGRTESSVSLLEEGQTRRGIGFERDLNFKPCVVGHIKAVLDDDKESPYFTRSVPEEEEATPKMTYLSGHYSVESAYLIEDYPTGYKGRCMMRIWIETIETGASKGKWRQVYQTTNPKWDWGVDGSKMRWRKEKKETGADIVILYLDGKGHHNYVSFYIVGRPKEDLDSFRQKHIEAFMADSVLQAKYDELVAKHYAQKKPKPVVINGKETDLTTKSDIRNFWG
jgi:hypothetical protein